MGALLIEKEKELLGPTSRYGDCEPPALSVDKKECDMLYRKSPHTQ